MKTKFLTVSGLLLLQLVSSVSFAWSDVFRNECDLGEVKAFVSTVQPNSEKWAKADGHVIELMSNVTLFSLYGNKFGGDGVRTFAFPLIKDVTVDALTFSYYVCTKGIFPTTTGASSPISFIKQYPLGMRYDLNYFRALNDQSGLADEYSEYGQAIFDDLKFEARGGSEGVRFPHVILPAGTENNDDGHSKLYNYVVVAGEWPSSEANCEKGEVLFGLWKHRAPGNTREFVPSTPITASLADGQLRTAPRIFICQ
ncbi:tail fiber protein [Bdellovibrio bacteriovorus]|nr:tail fiber protein [Bdellovibrio bacteriovorus]